MKFFFYSVHSRNIVQLSHAKSSITKHMLLKACLKLKYVPDAFSKHDEKMANYSYAS